MIEVVNMEADTTSAIGPARFLMPSIKLRRDIFDIGVLIEPGMCALHIEGDLDRDSKSVFDRVLREISTAHLDEIVINFARLTFADASGAAILARALELLRRKTRTLRFTGIPDALGQYFRAIRILDMQRAA